MTTKMFIKKWDGTYEVTKNYMGHMYTKKFVESMFGPSNTDLMGNYIDMLNPDWGKRMYDGINRVLNEEMEKKEKYLKSLYKAQLSNFHLSMDDIDDVFFNNNGVTTIKWKDGSVTTVKCRSDKGDEFNPEVGIAMCICKKAFGNDGSFNEVFKKYCGKYEDMTKRKSKKNK